MPSTSAICARRAQRRGLALWVYGAVLAQSACQSAVLAALLAYGRYHALRHRPHGRSGCAAAPAGRRARGLREWLDDGSDKAAPCATPLVVEDCFAPLLRWMVGWWQGRELALAVDATPQGERLAALVVSVLYRGGALPVAWTILPANRPGPWLTPLLRLLRLRHPAVPAGWTVLVLADRGLWSPRLWAQIRALGWHPLLRVQNHITIAPDGRERCTARALARPGEAWLGRGRLGTPKKRGLRVTLIAVWCRGQKAPWAPPRSPDRGRCADGSVGLLAADGH